MDASMNSGFPSFVNKLNQSLPDWIAVAIEGAASRELNGEPCEIEVDSGSSGEGFIAQMLKVTIKTVGGRTLNWICKIPPLLDARREQLASTALCDREVQVYSTVFPAMFEFQREKGIAESDGFFCIPQIFLSEDQGAMLIMDDLNTRGFRLYDKLNPVDYDHVKLMVTQLGRLHAVSFALKDQRPELFEKLKYRDMTSTLMTDSNYFRYMVEYSLEQASRISGLEENERAILLETKRHVVELTVKCTDAEEAEPYAVMGHGDCWINNFMFRYDEINRVQEIMFIDWQMCRYVSPVLDLTEFLFTGTSAEFRRNHYEEVLQIYHHALCQLLTKLGGEPDRQFPFKALLEQIQKFARYALVSATFLVPVMCIDKQHLTDMDEAAEQHKDSAEFRPPYVLSGDARMAYNKRMLGVIRDIVPYLKR